MKNKDWIEKKGKANIEGNRRNGRKQRKVKEENDKN